MMLLKRLKSVENVNIFSNWQDREVELPHEFARQTVIFGPNGSGKSTLASIFDSIQLSQAGQSPHPDLLAGVQFEVLEDTTIKKRSAEAEMPPTIVYNQAYVNRVLGKAFTEGGEADPLYVLGERNVEIEAEIDTKRSHLSDLQRNRETRTSLLAAARSEKNTLLGAVKSDVDELLGDYDRGRYNKTAFNVTKAEQLLSGQNEIAGSQREQLDHDQLERERYNLTLTVDGVGPDLQIDSPPGLGDLPQRIASVADSTVTARPIPRLEASQPLAEWARQGLELHQADERCGFCDGRLTDERLRQLWAHFDESYDTLHAELDRLDAELRDLADSVKHAWESFTASRDCLPQSAVSELQPQLDRYWEAVHTWIESGLDLISERKNAPFATLERSPAAEPDYGVWHKIQELVGEYNRNLQAQRDNLSTIRRDAERRILRHTAGKHGLPYDSSDSSVREAEEGLRQVDEAIDVTRQAITDLSGQQADVDGRRLASALSQDLFEYFGHRQLQVTYEAREDGNEGYIFWRGDQVATNLSEGEKNAIALLYFLRSLESMGRHETMQDACLVIDDPVSSLDQDAILSAFGFLWSRTQGPNGLMCSQLIILTHNFDFFRFWKQNLRNQWEKDRTDPKAWRRVSFLELQIVTRQRGGTWERTPVLREMGKGVDKWDSEYYYLFEQICKSTVVEYEDLLGLTGNAMRRLLESFVRWKRPQTAMVINAVDDVGAAHEVPGEVTARVVNALNNASHRSELDITHQTRSSALKEDIRAALRFIRQIDREHFEGMCKAVGREPDLAEET